MAKRTYPEELASCPFCGGKAFTLVKPYKRMSDIPGRAERWTGLIYWAGCDNENCWQPKVHGPTEEYVRDLWNKREGTCTTHVQ
jgi:hypothetical protein